MRTAATTDEDKLHDMFSSLPSEEGLPLTSATKILADQGVQIVEHFETLLKVECASVQFRPFAN